MEESSENRRIAGVLLLAAQDSRLFVTMHRQPVDVGVAAPEGP
jgi:hypothetical protein